MLPARSLGTLLVALSFAGCGSPELASRQERIVLVVIDTLRADHVSPHSPRRRTPHFARLAEKGQVFERASGSYYQTTMSMASLFTGRTPSLEGTSRTAPLAGPGKIGAACGALPGKASTIPVSPRVCPRSQGAFAKRGIGR
ncbi:MAG: sulfatase-like hydrolase/transferase [Myxococcota bacterium]